MDIDTIQINSGLHDYKVCFTEDFVENLSAVTDTAVYVIDKNVYRLYKEKFQVIDKQKIYFFDATENHKNMDTVMDLLSFFQKLNMKKNWKVICFGGGITQDVVAVASNLFLRNVDWIFFPTTLLSMCDSCIGGKSGINFGPYKNQIGVFYPPGEIIIDTHFIHTLSEEDYLNGWGELLKFSLTDGETFYNELKNEKTFIPCTQLEEYIKKGLLVKKKIIEIDEFESDLRRVLNYGHTFGHALEAYTKNIVPHGKGVIWGIDVANYIAWKEGLIDRSYYLEIKSLIKKAFITEEVIIENPKELFAIIHTDKKVRGNILYFALLDRRSHLVVYPVEINQTLENIFLNYIEETHEYYSD